MAKYARSEENGKRWRESAGLLVRGVNVRRDVTEPDVWHVAPQPGRVRADGWIPFQRMPLPGTGADALFMLNGSELGVIVIEALHQGDPLSWNVDSIGMLPEEPLHMEAVTAGTIKVLLRYGRTRYITYSRTTDDAEKRNYIFVLQGELPELPMPMLGTTDETSVSEAFGDVSLSGNTSRYGRLDNADTKTVSRHLAWAYHSLRRTTCALGYAVQPVIARCRLLDAAGDTIAVTAPVLLAATGGFQCCGEVELSSADNGMTFGGSTLTARAYRARLVIPRGMSAPWRDIVAALVVETSPLLSPVDEEGLSHSALSANGSGITLKLRLPGIPATSDAVSALQLRLIGEAAASHEFRTQLRIERPYAIEEETERTIAIRDGDCVTFPAFHPLRDDVSYGACHYSPGYGTVLLADPMTEAFAGHSPATMMTSSEKQTGASWKATATVTLRAADGTETTAAAGASGTGRIVKGFSPLLTYPDRDAREITLTVANTTATGVVTILTETYPLTPLPGAGCAAYAATGVSSIMPGSIAERMPTLPAVTVEGRIERGLLNVCKKGLGTMPLASLRCGEGGIVAMADAPRSKATWDFARRKLLVFGEDGIRMVTLDADSQFRSGALLDNRPVKSRYAVSIAARGGGLQLLAVAGGDLVSVSQSAVSTLMTHCRGEMPAWCARHNEIWLSGGDAPVRRITIRKGVAEETEVRCGETAGEITPVMWGGRLLVQGTGGLFDTSLDSEEPVTTYFSLCLRHRLDSAALPLRHLAVNLYASSFHGEVTVAADNGSRTAEKLVGLAIDGEINAPLPVTVMAPLRQWIETTAAGTASPDCEWRPVMTENDGTASLIKKK